MQPFSGGKCSVGICPVFGWFSSDRECKNLEQLESLSTGA